MIFWYKIMTYKDIISKLKRGELSPVYILHGPEPFFIDEISSYMENNLLSPDEQDMNQTVVYGKDTDAFQVDTMARAFPFGADRRVVIVKEAKDLSNIEKLASYIANPSMSTVLVLCHKYGKAPAKLLDAAKKTGEVFLSEQVKDYKLAAWAMDQAKEHRLQLNSEAAAVLAEFIGNDLSRINNELVKLRLHLPENSSTVTTDIVKENIGVIKEYNIFELQDAFGMRNETKVYKIALNFCKNINLNPNVKTITILASFFMKLLSYHYAPDRSSETLKSVFGTNSDYVVKKNSEYAQLYSVDELKKIISVLREYDVKAKGVDTAASQEDLLKEMVYKILH